MPTTKSPLKALNKGRRDVKLTRNGISPKATATDYNPNNVPAHIRQTLNDCLDTAKCFLIEDIEDELDSKLDNKRYERILIALKQLIVIANKKPEKGDEIWGIKGMEDDDEAPTCAFLHARNDLLIDETPETIAEYTNEMDELFDMLHTARLLEMQNHYGADDVEYAPEALQATVERLQTEKAYLEENVIEPLQECAMACRDKNIYSSLDSNFKHELEKVIGKCNRAHYFEPEHYTEDGMPMMLSEYTSMEADLRRRKDVVQVLESRLNCLIGLTNLALYVI